METDYIYTVFFTSTFMRNANIYDFQRLHLNRFRLLE